MKLRIAIGLAVVATAFAGGVWASGSGLWKWAPNPDSGLSDAERLQAHEENSDAFWAKYAEWVVKQGVDIKSLHAYPVGSLLATVRPGAATLADAVALSDLVLQGNVTAVEFRSTADMVVTFEPVSAAKGRADVPVKILVPCMLQPDEQWANPSIACVEAIPMMYPGDSLIVMARVDPGNQGFFAVQPWTGMYWVDPDGSVRAVDGNPFWQSMRSLSATALLQAVEAAQP